MFDAPTPEPICGSVTASHYVCERVRVEEVQVVSARTDEMFVDCMTKALTPDKHLTACNLLGVAQGGKRAA